LSFLICATVLRRRAGVQQRECLLQPFECVTNCLSVNASQNTGSLCYPWRPKIQILVCLLLQIVELYGALSQYGAPLGLWQLFGNLGWCSGEKTVRMRIV